MERRYYSSPRSSPRRAGTVKRAGQGQFCACGSPRFCPWTSVDNGDSDERIVGGSTLSLGDATADLTATIPFTTSAGCGASCYAAPPDTVKIQRARSSTVSAYNHHTVIL